MAETKDNPTTAKDTPQQETQATPTKKAEAKKTVVKKPAESTYEAAELAKAARSRFGVPPEIVTTAMRLSGKGRVTMEEAQKIVEKFMTKEIV